MLRTSLQLMVIAGLFFVTNLTQAATLYIDPGVATLYRGDALTTSVRLMPDQATGECVNAVDAVITYSESIQPVDVSIGRSIFNVWVESPVINRENRTITFAGGIPNGYCGRVQGDPRLTNIIADIVFRSPGLQIGMQSESNTAVIQFAPETQAYLNDGQGTKANLVTLGSTLTLERTAGAGVVDEWREEVRGDNIPPEEFSITLVRDDITFGGKYFIVFSTTDKQTGISHYEVVEEPISDFGRFAWGGTNAPWVRATSPYVLDDQSLTSTIRVKAFDKAGNEYIATLVPEESLQSVSRSQLIFWLMLGGLLVSLIVVILLVVYLIRRRRKLNLASVVSEDLDL